MTSIRPTGLNDLVDAWLAGFAHSRSAPVRRHGRVVELDVNSDKRRLELVMVDPDEALLIATACRLVDTTDVWLTLVTSERRSLPALPDGVRVLVEDEVLMVADTLDPAPPVTAMEQSAADGRCFTRLMAGEVVACQGQAAVVGSDVVFDRIGTDPAHRRRGLASDTMRTLTTWALAEGATRGLLAATVLGRPLYEGLGFRTVATLTTLSGGAS